MNILDGLGETLNSAYNDVSKKAKDASDIAKLSYKIKQKESFVSVQYGAIGKAFFEDHKDDATPAYEGVALINEALQEIEELKEELAKIKGTKKCPGCGAELKGKPAYCSKCGTKIEYEEEAEAKEEVAEDKPAEEEKTEEGASESKDFFGE